MYILQVTFVVIYHLLVFDSSKLSNSWGPDKQSKDMLSTVPALFLRCSDHSPLCISRYHCFVAKMTLNDEFCTFTCCDFCFGGLFKECRTHQLSLIKLIHSLRCNHVPKLQTLPDFFHLLVLLLNRILIQPQQFQKCCLHS